MYRNAGCFLQASDLIIHPEDLLSSCLTDIIYTINQKSIELNSTILWSAPQCGFRTAGWCDILGRGGRI